MNTKLASYNSLGNRSTARQRVLDALTIAPMSRQQIATATGLRLSSVCGRVNELIHLELVEASGLMKDPTTNKVVEVLSPRTTK